MYSPASISMLIAKRHVSACNVAKFFLMAVYFIVVKVAHWCCDAQSINDVVGELKPLPPTPSP